MFSYHKYTYIERKWITLFILFFSEIQCTWKPVLVAFAKHLPLSIVCTNVIWLFLFYSEELRKEARQLKRELLAAKQKKENSAKQAEERSEGKSIYQAYIFTWYFSSSHCPLFSPSFLLFPASFLPKLNFALKKKKKRKILSLDSEPIE